MPGSAIGNTNNNEMVSRPKKSYLVIAAAAKDPKTSAIAVAHIAVITERITASLMPSFAAALLHHSVVNPVGGQANDLFVLNELITTRTNGR